MSTLVKSFFADLRELLPDTPLRWQPIERAYQGRAYHNLDHLTEMIDHLQQHPSESINDPAIFGLALLYHDIVYKPTRSDNEARSACSASELVAKDSSVGQQRINRCYALIMATKDHSPPADDDGDAALLIDLDLAVLARPTADYDNYRKAVRREFWMIPGFVYRKGRTKALTGFLDRPHIYHTAYGRENYEAKARENLWRELREM